MKATIRSGQLIADELRHQLPWWAAVPRPQRLDIETRTDSESMTVRATWDDGVLGTQLKCRMGEASLPANCAEMRAAMRWDDKDGLVAAVRRTVEQAIIAAGITPWERKSGRVNGKWRAWLAPRRRPK